MGDRGWFWTVCLIKVKGEYIYSAEWRFSVLRNINSEVSPNSLHRPKTNEDLCLDFTKTTDRFSLLEFVHKLTLYFKTIIVFLQAGSNLQISLEIVIEWCAKKNIEHKERKERQPLLQGHHIDSSRCSNLIVWQKMRLLLLEPVNTKGAHASK